MYNYSIQIYNKTMWNVTQRLLFNYGYQWFSGSKKLWKPLTRFKNYYILFDFNPNLCTEKLIFFSPIHPSLFSSVTEIDIEELRKILRGDQL